ncbi:MAG: phospho-N-acetylmuramoyl-pentapeptide-transferase [Kiritimatiellae bacterium]|nr:phospho-N-acetylmuramoyl-pentapeptide-transferase [Kiritimatiellia bacterium]
MSEWSRWWGPLNLFQYVTFRALGGAATAFALSLLLGPAVIRRLTALRLRHPSRLKDVPELDRHYAAKKVPTMGGVLIIGTTSVAALLWAMPSNALVWLTLAVMWTMGAVGAADDLLKITARNAKGLPARWKLAAQSACAIALVAVLWQRPEWRPMASDLAVPFLKTPLIANLGPVPSALFALVVLAGCSNAVNLTDGLDGLAVGCSGSAAMSYLVMAYCAGHAVFARYLLIPYVPGAGELAVVCGCLVGACLGFLWWNCRPAQMFMGDTGSLALGGAIATVAMLINQELTLILVGGVFVLESLSVIIQVLYFRWSGGRRVFRCAPIHHHFEWNAKDQLAREGLDPGLAESRVTVRFWIVSLILALAGIATLKIR